jgi:hypothetical protein
LPAAADLLMQAIEPRRTSRPPGSLADIREQLGEHDAAVSAFQRPGLAMPMTCSAGLRLMRLAPNQ